MTNDADKSKDKDWEIITEFCNVDIVSDHEKSIFFFWTDKA